MPRVIQPVFEIAELPGRASIKAEARLFGSAEDDGTDDWKRMLDMTSTCVSQSIVASHRSDCLTGSLSLLASQLEEQLSTMFAESATWLIDVSVNCDQYCDTLRRRRRLRERRLLANLARTCHVANYTSGKHNLRRMVYEYV